MPRSVRSQFRQFVRSGACALLSLSCLAVLGESTNASAVQTPQPSVVGAIPAAYTPDVDDGIVYAIAQVGPTVFLGGSFTSVSPHGSTATTSVDGVAAFTAGTGTLLTSFAPVISGGIVKTVIPGPEPGTVYVGGSFTQIDGVTSRVALLDANTGAIVAGWNAKNSNAAVWKLVLGDGQLFVGGSFSKFAGAARSGLATLDPMTGALTSYSTLQFTGHHNYLVNCTPSTSKCVKGAVGIKSMDVSPDGTRMVVIGNFTDVSGSPRDQVAMLDLDGTSASVDSTWATDAFTAACASKAFDSYVRDIQFSPDGSYFAIVATGSGGTSAKNTDGTRAICDAVARFETDGSGSDVQPTWVEWTGGDTFWSVSITGTAIYAGGHQRWLNNPKGANVAKPGAVPRPGIAAVDPQNGMPLAWNPGRNPRGKGAYALLATADGLYVGSDTNWIGNFQYKRQKLAFFPLAGGYSLPSNSVGSLPGQVYLFGTSSDPSGAQTVTWDGMSSPQSVPDTTGFNNSTVRGAFAVNGNLYFGSTDGHFYEAPFSNGVAGTPVAVDPYDDPYWDSVDTGSGQTYQGVASSFYTELGSLTSMFYSNGRVYYTLAGKTQMFWRYFETDDGVMGAQEFTTTDGNNWSHVAGAFLSGNTLYFANSSNGNLMSVPFVGGQPAGTPTVADNSMNWSSHGDVVLSTSQNS